MWNMQSWKQSQVHVFKQAVIMLSFINWREPVRTFTPLYQQRHGSLLLIYSAGTRRCQLAPQLPPARAAAFGLWPNGCRFLPPVCHMKRYRKHAYFRHSSNSIEVFSLTASSHCRLYALTFSCSLLTRSCSLEAFFFSSSPWNWIRDSHISLFEYIYSQIACELCC